MSVQYQCSFCPQTFFRRPQLYDHANKDHFDHVSTQWIQGFCEKCQTFFPSGSDLDSHLKSSHTEAVSIGGTLSIQCNFCEKKYNSKQNYYLHVNKTHRNQLEQEWFYCERCDSFFPTLEILRNHESHSHDDQKMRTCPFCPKVMTRMSIFYKHANESHRDQLAGNWLCCDTCQNYYPSKFVLDKHKMSTHANAVRTTERLQCDFCPKQLISTYAYYSHANKSHLHLLHGRWFCCDECNKFFPNKPVLDSHKSTVHSKADDSKRRLEKVTCEFCAQTLRNRAIYYKHTNKLHQQQITHWHPCDICQLFYPTLEILDKHKRQRHQPDGAPGSSLKPTMKIKCKFCPRTFNGNIWYYKHANIAHFNMVVDRWILCEKCETYVPSEISLKRHQRKYHAEVASKAVSRVHCKFCPKMFITNSIYYLHCNRAHREHLVDKWVPCSTCQRFYPTKKDIDAHKCRGPPEEHKIDTRSHFVQCGFCNAIENNASAFYRHANKEHHDQLAMSNWVECPMCNYYYPDKEVLRSHKKHSHERALQPRTIKCKYCSKELPDHDSYYRHANTAHLMGILGKWFFCVRCQYFYPNRTVLENHQSDDHTEVAKVIIVQNMTENGLAALSNAAGNGSGGSQVTVINPAAAADALNLASKANKDAIIVLANSGTNRSGSSALDGVGGHGGGGVGDGDRTQCLFCEKAFAERHHFINHANKVHREHIVDTWLCCEPCTKYFPDENVMALHNSHTHNKGKGTVNEDGQFEDMDGVGESGVKMVCEFCPKSFKHRSYYFCHANKAHPHELVDNWLGCDECDRRYPDKTVMASHKARFHRIQKSVEADAGRQFYVVRTADSNKSPKKKYKSDYYEFETVEATGTATSTSGVVTTTTTTSTAMVTEDFWPDMEIENFSVVTTNTGGDDDDDQQTTTMVVVQME